MEGGKRKHIYYKTEQKKHITFTFKALFVETPEQTATVLTESGAPVVVGLEAMRHIDLEAFSLELQAHREQLKLYNIIYIKLFLYI